MPRSGSERRGCRCLRRDAVDNRPQRRKIAVNRYLDAIAGDRIDQCHECGFGCRRFRQPQPRAQCEPGLGGDGEGCRRRNFENRLRIEGSRTRDETAFDNRSGVRSRAVAVRRPVADRVGLRKLNEQRLQSIVNALRIACRNRVGVSVIHMYTIRIRAPGHQRHAYPDQRKLILRVIALDVKLERCEIVGCDEAEIGAVGLCVVEKCEIPDAQADQYRNFRLITRNIASRRRQIETDLLSERPVIGPPAFGVCTGLEQQQDGRRGDPTDDWFRHIALLWFFVVRGAFSRAPAREGTRALWN